ncbi:MAG: diguanylate cyclase [Planctomycetaceae bacterium]
MIRALEILYVGRRCPEAAQEIAARGGVVRAAAHVYEGIAALKRDPVSAAIVEYGEVEADPAGAVQALRASAGRRPLLFAFTADEWDTVRGRGIFEHEEVLLRPFYPDELWRRITRSALPDEGLSVRVLKDRTERLAALLEDAQRLNRLTGDIAALAEQCVEIVRARVRAGRVSIFLKDRATGGLRVVHAVGLREEARAGAQCAMGEGVAGAAAQQRRPVLVREAGRDGPAAGHAYDGSSYMIVPLVYQHDVLGILCVTERLDPGPFSPDDLAYLEAFAESAALVVHNAYALRAADELATIDELTGLFNRRYFNRVLAQEVQRAQRYHHDLTLAILDVDFFKQFNDSMGHQEGDRALAAIARILKNSFRQTDIVVRHGGEEFAVLMPETTRKEGNGIGFVDRARRAVEAEGLAFEHQGIRRVLTISGGVATFPHQAATPEDLVRRADQALYEAKRLGRNRIKGA